MQHFLCAWDVHTTQNFSLLSFLVMFHICSMDSNIIFSLLICYNTVCRTIIISSSNYDVINTPSLKAFPSKPRKAIFMEWSWTWLSRSSYGIYVAITECMWLLRGMHGNLPSSSKPHVWPCNRHHCQVFRPQNCHEVATSHSISLRSD